MARDQIKTRVILERLKHVRSVAALLTASVVWAAAGCGSGESSTNSTSTNAQSGINAAQENSATDTRSSNLNSGRSVDTQMQRLEEMRKSANRSGQAAPSPISVPAPEDSFITATLTDVARETRTWTKHPVLLKVEKIHNGDGSLKVYLRSGKVIDLPGTSISQLREVTAASVMELAGVSAPLVERSKRTGRRPTNSKN